MLSFELCGRDGDETRLLRSPAVGYSISLAGRPTLLAQTSHEGCDAVIELGDVPAHHGFRIDTLPRHASPQELASSLAASYRDGRAVNSNARVRPLALRPEWAIGGAEVIYQRRDESEPLMENLNLYLRAAPDGLWALYHTTWFKTADLNSVRWGHLRASFLEQHAWTGDLRDTPANIWPPSEFALPLALLDLTDQAALEAGAKAIALGHLSPEQVGAVASALRDFSQQVYSPRTYVPEIFLNDVARRVQQSVPPNDAAILLRNLKDCKNRHDLRGWIWQCILAVDNRAELRAAPSS